MRLPSSLQRHNTFLGNVATMMSGKSISAVIALLTMPIVARLFSPSDFGIAAVFLSLVGIVSNVGTLRYSAALVLPDHEPEALLLMALAYRILIALCAIMLLLIAGYELSNWAVPLLESLGAWLWLLPLGILLLTTLGIQENWLARKRQFKIVAVSMVVGSTTTGGTRIGFGIVGGSSVIGLLAGNMLGQVCQLAIQKTASSEGLRSMFRRMTWSQIRHIAAKYSDFPRLNAPAALLSAVAQQLPVLLLGVLFSPAIVGFYAMAMRLSHVPVEIVAKSVRRVFLQKAAEINNRGRSMRLAFLLSTGALALVGAIPLVVLWFFGEPLVTWLLGERWAQGGRFLEIVAPWLYMIWITAPSNSVFVVLRKQRAWLTLQATVTALRMATFGLAYALAAGPEWTVGAFVTATVIGNLIIIATAVLFIARNEHEALRQGV